MAVNYWYYPSLVLSLHLQQVMRVNKRRNSATVNIFLPPEREIKWPQFRRSFIAVSRCVKLLICALTSNLLRGENKDLGRHLLLPEAFFHISPITTKVTFRFFFHDSSVISHNLLRLHHYFLYFLIFRRKKNRSLFLKPHYTATICHLICSLYTMHSHNIGTDPQGPDSI